MPRLRFSTAGITLLFAGIILIFAIMVVTSSNTPRNQPPAPPINQLYIFGDSLSDVGNVFRATNGYYPPSPPYFQGRYSNGRVWVEQLASQLKLAPAQVKNFAWGGATTGQFGVSSVPGLLGQIGEFTRNNPQASAQALYVVWAGTNDYLYTQASATASIDNLSKALRSLIQVGAKRFVVGNLPDLGKLPATRSASSSAALSKVAIAHNQALNSLLDQLQQSGVQIARLDISALYQDAIAAPGRYGFTNVNSAYIDQSVKNTPPDQFLFWDGIHPTAAAHKVLGERAFSLIQNVSTNAMN